MSERERAAAQEACDRVRVVVIILGLAPVHPLHVESMAKDKGNPFLLTEVSEPMPHEDAFAANDEVLAEGFDGLEEALGISQRVAFEYNVAAGIE